MSQNSFPTAQIVLSQEWPSMWLPNPPQWVLTDLQAHFTLSCGCSVFTDKANHPHPMRRLQSTQSGYKLVTWIVPLTSYCASILGHFFSPHLYNLALLILTDKLRLHRLKSFTQRQNMPGGLFDSTDCVSALSHESQEKVRIFRQKWWQIEAETLKQN